MSEGLLRAQRHAACVVGQLWVEEKDLGGIRSCDRFLGRLTLLRSWLHVSGGHVLSSGERSSSQAVFERLTQRKSSKLCNNMKIIYDLLGHLGF